MRRREPHRTANMSLPELPSDEEVIGVVREIVTENRLSASHVRQIRGASANEVAYRLRVAPANRLGNGAVAGSWSGTMSPALRVAPRLRSLAARGLLRASWDREFRGRWLYFPREGG